jgi:membrane protein implicated in regulation of membrane protease activity
MAFPAWQWLVLGIALCVVEIFLPSFTILWFGLGAVVVAVLTLLWSDIPLAVQVALWALLTAVFAIAWFRYFKPRMLDRTKAGISREAAVGQVGMVINAGSEHVRGTVRFSVPLLGADEWPYICEQSLQAGDRCRVIDVLGNALLVEKF